MVTEFPVDNVLIQGAFKVFNESSRRILMEYAPIVFLIRVVVNMFSLRGAEDYVDLLKDTVLMFVGVMLFREVMLLILKVPGEARELVETFGMPKGFEAKSEVVQSLLDSPLGILGFSLNDLDLTLGYFLKWIALFVYWVVYWLYFLFIFLAICLGSYVIFFASMFRMKWVLSAFLIIVTIASLWPFLWYGTDYVLSYAITEMAKQGSSAGILTSSVFTNLIKIVVPLGSLLWAMSNPVGKVSQIGLGMMRTAKVAASPFQGSSRAQKSNYLNSTAGGSNNGSYTRFDSRTQSDRFLNSKNLSQQNSTVSQNNRTIRSRAVAYSLIQTSETGNSQSISKKSSNNHQNSNSSRILRTSDLIMKNGANPNVKAVGTKRTTFIDTTISKTEKTNKSTILSPIQEKAARAPSRDARKMKHAPLSKTPPI